MVVGVIMRDFKIRMDGPVKGATGFQALRTKKLSPVPTNLELFSVGNWPSCDPNAN